MVSQPRRVFPSVSGPPALLLVPPYGTFGFSKWKSKKYEIKNPVSSFVSVKRVGSVPALLPRASRHTSAPYLPPERRISDEKYIISFQSDVEEFWKGCWWWRRHSSHDCYRRPSPKPLANKMVSPRFSTQDCRTCFVGSLWVWRRSSNHEVFIVEFVYCDGKRGQAQVFCMRGGKHISLYFSLDCSTCLYNFDYHGDECCIHYPKEAIAPMHMNVLFNQFYTHNQV